MPRLLRARRPQDAEEERKVRKLAGSRHAPGDWNFRARINCRSWQGLRNAEIAKELFISQRTVNGHMGSVYNKLGFNTRAEATRFAVEHGLL